MKHKLKLVFYALSTVISGLFILFFLLVMCTYIGEEDKGGMLFFIIFLILSVFIFVYFAVKFKKENTKTNAPPPAQNTEIPVFEVHNIPHENIQINNTNTISGNLQPTIAENNPPEEIQNNIIVPEEPVEIPHNEPEVTTPVENQSEPEISDNISPDINVSRSELLLLKIDSVATSGSYFERIACKLLEANGYINVKNTQTSNDYGIDILAEKDGISYAIQCKCYSSSVGNKAVQEAYSGKGFYNCMVAVVFTNSKFTKRAIETAKATQVLLWDRTKLIEMIDNLNDENIKNIINSTI